MKHVSLHGYRRPDGRVGFRNLVVLLPSCMCSVRAAELAGESAPGAVVVSHPHGCSQTESDAAFTMRQLIGCATNPNVAAVVVVGLGCEQAASEELADGVAAAGRAAERVVIQDEGGVKRAAAKAARLARKHLARAEKTAREPVGFESLLAATECGGSDAFSGLTANPAVGAASDLILEAGGSVILSETTEMIGAEHVLAKRAAAPEIARQVKALVRGREREIRALGDSLMGGNPSPGNIAGGITTLEEKSLGCIYKAGRGAIQEVLEFGQRPSRRGLVIMDTPGNDVESLTGMAAGGAQICMFTTGRGSPVGCAFMPVLKIASNTPMFERLRAHMDVNAGVIAEGKASTRDVGRRLFHALVRALNGKPTKAERLGCREFALHRLARTY